MSAGNYHSWQIYPVHCERIKKPRKEKWRHEVFWFFVSVKVINFSQIIVSKQLTKPICHNCTTACCWPFLFMCEIATLMTFTDTDNRKSRERVMANALWFHKRSYRFLFIMSADIDECASGVHICHKFASCTNTVGSYSCSCTAHYTGDGRTCTRPYDGE